MVPGAGIVYALLYWPVALFSSLLYLWLDQQVFDTPLKRIEVALVFQPRAAFSPFLIIVVPPPIY